MVFLTKVAIWFASFVIGVCGAIGFLAIYSSKCKFKIIWRICIVLVMALIAALVPGRKTMWAIGLAVNFFATLFVVSLCVAKRESEDAMCELLIREGILNDLE